MADPGKAPFVSITLTSGWGPKVDSEPNFTSESIQTIEKYSYSQCEAPFTVQSKPALWCAHYADKFMNGFAKYTLFIHDQGTLHEVYFENWRMPTNEAKASAVSVAETAFFHRPLSAEALKRNATYAHQAHSLRKGAWMLLEKTQGEGYFNIPLLAPSAFATCINDQGASLQKLLPQPIASCQQRVKQESRSKESITVDCQNHSSDHFDDKYSDRYEFMITYVDAEHYTVEGTHTRFETVEVKQGIATYERPQAIGSQSLRLVASWKNEKCGLETDAPVPLTASSIINR